MRLPQTLLRGAVGGHAGGHVWLDLRGRGLVGGLLIWRRGGVWLFDGLRLSCRRFGLCRFGEVRTRFNRRITRVNDRLRGSFGSFGTQNHALQGGWVAIGSDDDEVEMRAVQQHGNGVARGGRRNVGDDLLLFRACWNGDVGAGAAMNLIKNF